MVFSKNADLALAIKEVFKGEVLADDPTLVLYSHDASLFEVKPSVVVCPKDSDDVKALVKFVSGNKKDNPDLSLTARSGGTDMTGGSINESIIIDFSKHINHVGEINASGTMVEPGVFYRDFEKKTLEKNLLLPSYPASKNICCLGGMIGNNAGGEKTLSYGKTIDYVTGLSMVLSDGGEYTFGKLSNSELTQKMGKKDFEGEVYRKIFEIADKNFDLVKNAKPRVSKNSTGYNIWDVWDKENFDLTKLFVGAQGTLGLNTKITLKLVEAKKHSGLLVVYLDDLKILPPLINDVLKSKPDSFEVFDDRTLRLAIRFLPQFAKVLGVGGMVKMGLQFLPDLASFAVKGMPKFILLVEFDSNDVQEISEKIQRLNEVLKSYPIKVEFADTDEKAGNFWAIRRESFNLLRKNVKNKHTAPFIDDFIIQPASLVEFFPKLTEILERHKLDYTVAGHMGDGNFHIIPLMDFNDLAEKEKIPVVEDEVNALVLNYHGSISAEHNDGLVRGHYLRKMYGDKMFEVFRAIKKIFDPENIFNPHKKTDARFEYSIKHIREKF